MTQVLTPEPFRRVDASREDVPGEDQFKREVLEGLDKLFQGQSDLTEAFGALAPRVAKLEADAQWKRRGIALAKAAAPFLLGLGAHYLPGIARHVPAILEALSSL